LYIKSISFNKKKAIFIINIALKNYFISFIISLYNFLILSTNFILSSLVNLLFLSRALSNNSNKLFLLDKTLSVNHFLLIKESNFLENLVILVFLTIYFFSFNFSLNSFNFKINSLLIFIFSNLFQAL
jgi:hypothetical protein